MRPGDDDPRFGPEQQGELQGAVLSRPERSRHEAGEHGRFNGVEHPAVYVSGADCASAPAAVWSRSKQAGGNAKPPNAH